jgi:hypothetical protein
MRERPHASEEMRLRTTRRRVPGGNDRLPGPDASELPDAQTPPVRLQATLGDRATGAAHPEHAG